MLGFISPAFSQQLRFDLESTICFYHIQEQETRQYNSRPGLKSSIGITYKLPGKISITSGIGLSVVSYNTAYGFITLQQNDPLVPVSSEIRATYLDIPLLINYQLSTNTKTNLYLNSGIVSSQLVREDDKTIFQDHSVRSSGYLNSQLLSFQFGAGVLFALNEKLSLKLEPQYRLFQKSFDRMMFNKPSALNIVFGIAYYPSKN
jgi:opacity protein-like surface antigen